MERENNRLNPRRDRPTVTHPQAHSRRVNEVIPVTTAAIGGVITAEYFNRNGGLLVIAAAAVVALKFARNR